MLHWKKNKEFFLSSPWEFFRKKTPKTKYIYAQTQPGQMITIHPMPDTTECTVPSFLPQSTRRKTRNKMLILEELAPVNTLKCELYRRKLIQIANKTLFCFVSHLLMDLFKTGIEHYIMDLFLILPRTSETKHIFLVPIKDDST